MKTIPLVTLEEADRLLADHADREDALKDLVGRMLHQSRLATTSPLGIRMTRTRIANLLGVTPQTLYNWERGAILPSPKKFNRLVEILLAPDTGRVNSETANQ